MKTEHKRLFIGLGLVLIFLLGFLLRLQQSHHFRAPDEEQLADMIMNLRENPFPPGDYIVYPGYPPLMLYLHFLLCQVYQQTLLFLGAIRFPNEFMLSGYGRDFLLHSGRLVSALVGTALILLVFRMGNRLFNRATGFFAALLIAVNGFLIYDAHIFKPDTLMVVLLTICLCFALNFYREGNPRKLFWSGIWFGLAVAAKYNAAVGAVFLAVVIFWTARQHRTKGFFSRSIVLVSAGGLIGFMAGAPNWVVHPWANIQAAYRFITYHAFSFSFYEPRAAYLSYGKLLIQGFGLPLFIVFLIGLYFSIRKRRPIELMLTGYILLYVILLGHSSYFGERIVLPLLPPLALLISKSLFSDGANWMRLLSANGLKTAGQVFVMILLFLQIGSSVGRNIARFNLLRSESPYDQALAYRLRHIPSTYRLGRENLTPSLAGDMGFSDLTRIPLAAFRGRDALPFLCTGLFSDHIMRNVRKPEVRYSLNERLREYAPFHRIQKTPFSGFDAPITFWYRRPPYLHKVSAGKTYRHLPVLYSRPIDDLSRPTLFLPTQLYEKNPFFFRTQNGIFGATLYATQPLDSLTCYLLTTGENRSRIYCNGREGHFIQQTVGNPMLQVARFPSPAPRRLYHDWVYQVEIVSEPRDPILYGYFDSLGTDLDKLEPEKAFLREPITGSVPDLFSSTEIPSWCRRFYRETGIDPLLFRFIQTESLWVNEHRSLIDRELAVTAIEPGDYLLRIRGEKIDQSSEYNGLPALYCILLNDQRTTETVLPLFASPSPGEWMGRLSAPQRGFLRLSLRGQRQANILVTQVVMEVDLVSYLNRFWLINEKKALTNRR